MGIKKKSIPYNFMKKAETYKYIYEIIPVIMSNNL